MKIGIAIEETWDFLHEIFEDLSTHHEVKIFQRPSTNWPIFRERRERALFKRELIRFLQENDVVFFEWASELLSAASKLPKTCGIVTRIHRYEMYQWVDKINWETVDKVILVSEAKKSEFTQKFPRLDDKTTVIYEAVSLDKFPFQPKAYSGDIGILCHLTPRKRIYELILDFYELIKINPSFHLHIGGDPHHSHLDYLASMHSLVHELNIENQVTFYGPVTDTPNWYQKIDIFISNAYSEGLQVALLEAMASGCYALSHHWAGVDELLPAENLYFTGKELQQGILTFAEKSAEDKLDLRRQMRKLVENQSDVDQNKIKIREIIETAGSHQK